MRGAGSVPHRSPVNKGSGRDGVGAFISGFMAAALSAAAAEAGRVCDLDFRTCPADFKNTVIQVPLEAVSVAAHAPFCSEGVKTGSGTASIVFIIDHSASMEGIDLNGSRFGVVPALLDEIKAAAPAAEIGVVVFSDILHFDDRDNPLFQPAFPGDAAWGHDAYIPLIALNKSFPGGRTGLDTLKALLRYKAVPGAGLKLNHETAFRTGGLTDITLGFDAAKAAMRSAASPKESRFFIFISDGLPGGVHADRAARADEYLKGEDSPATFTVYFDASGSAPEGIARMTEAIRANGYSTSNPKSSSVTVNQPGTQLLGTLRTQVLNQVFVSTIPDGVSVVSAGRTKASTAKDATGFVLPGRLPLRADTTLVRFEYGAAYADPSRGGANRDTVFAYDVRVSRSAAGAPPAGVELTCRDQADLQLFAGAVRLETVTSENASAEIRVTPAAGDKCQACPVDVRPSGSGDRESIALAAAGAYSRGTLKRALGAASPGDGILQHEIPDSLVVIYASPDTPLDVVRKSWPFRMVAPATLELRAWNQVARPGPVAAATERWLLLSTALDLPRERLTGRCCGYSSPLSPDDSGQFVGIRVEASGEFKLEARVFTNHGQFVGKTVLEVTRAEFDRLPPGSMDSTRILTLLWDGRDGTGHPVGTGAYVLAARATLKRTGTVNAYNRIVGILRARPRPAGSNRGLE